jgi:DNA-binding beta-propeller fold protein YncE
MSAGARAVLGTIPAGTFPRELRVTEDGRTLLVTNFNSSTLELVDLARLPLRSTVTAGRPMPRKPGSQAGQVLGRQGGLSLGVSFGSED